jgi:site-specific recombinase XerD
MLGTGRFEMPRKPKEKKHRGVFEREKGSNIWWVRFVDTDGKRKARCIGNFSDAVDFYEAEKVRIRRRIIAPIATHRGVRYDQLVDDALKYNETDHRDQRVFAQRLEVTREKFGHRVADSMTPAEISDWFADMIQERAWTPATVNRYRAAMSKAFKLGIQNRKLDNNPARLVPQRKEPAGRIRFLTEEEETRLRKALKSRPLCVPQLDVALHTGMRKSEQFSVTWDQVNFGLKYIHLSETKNGSDRYVSLNTKALQALQELKGTHARLSLPADSTLFVSWQKKPMADPREWFSAACEEAKIQGVTWHTLRHTFASRLVMAGVDLKTVQELMGHKTIAMTARYAHLSPAHKLTALEKLVVKPARGGARVQTALAQRGE